jgi:Domain of unknown function (DUF3943)
VKEVRLAIHKIALLGLALACLPTSLLVGAEKVHGLGPIAGSFSLAVKADPGPDRLPLSLFPKGVTPGFLNSSPALTEPDRPGTEPPLQKKRPWIAAVEVFGINAGVWAYDRYVLKADFSHISWKTWKANLRAGFAYDADPFVTNFFAHPYHGSTYYNAARSHGLTFWESIPYAAGGSLMWEYFGENTRPSINDAIMTTTGGIFLGETLFRLSSQVLDDSTSGGNRIWREIVAALIDPIRGLNRVLSGEAWRIRPVTGQIREPIHGNFAFSEKLVSETADLSHLKSSPGFEFDVIYGESLKEIESRSPMDLIILNSGLRTFDHHVYSHFNAYGLWFGKQFTSRNGTKNLLGLFQHYDYLRNELTHMGDTAFTAGLISLVPLGKRFELNSSLQLGPVVFGASNNKYTLVQQRDYNYGAGAVAEAEGWLSHPALGTLMLSVNHYQIYTFKAAALAADISHDYFTVFRTNYTIPLGHRLGLRLEYTLYARHLHFTGQAAYNSNESLVGAALDFSF